jgi:hypothetical protein
MIRVVWECCLSTSADMSSVDRKRYRVELEKIWITFDIKVALTEAIWDWWIKPVRCSKTSKV